MRNRNKWGFVVTAVFVLLALRNVDFSEVRAALISAHYTYLMPAALCTLAHLALRAKRWAMLLLPVKPVRTARLFPLMLIGLMVNNILPAKAGEIARAYLLNREEEVGTGAAVGSIVVARTLDVLAMLSLLGIVSLFWPLPGWGRDMGHTAGGILVVAASFLAALSLEPIRHHVLKGIKIALRPFPYWLSENAIQLILSFVEGIQSLRRGKLLISVIALTVSAWLMEVVAAHFALRVFGFSLPFYAPAFLLAVLGLGAAVPSSPGLVGVFHFLVILSLGVFGVPRAPALTFAIVYHALGYLLISSLGLWFLTRMRVSIRQLSHAKGRFPRRVS